MTNDLPALQPALNNAGNNRLQEPAPSQMLDRLWELQKKYGYISDEAISALASEFNITNIEVVGVVSFYHFFHRKPTGRFTIYLNNSIVSDFKGFHRIKETLERETGARFGSVDRSGTFGLFLTPCIGLSDQEPSALINFYPFTNLNAIKVKDIISKLKNGVLPEDICDHPADNIQYTPERSVFFSDWNAGAAIAKLHQLKPEGVIEEIKRSELSGRGGAYYPK